MTYLEFVTQYLNKRDTTGMYYTTAEIAKQSGEDISVIQKYLDFSQQANLIHVNLFGRAVTDPSLVLAWEVMKYYKDQADYLSR